MVDAAVELTLPDVELQSHHCTLCNSVITQRKLEEMNGAVTCKRCWRKFINRREGAFLFDCLIFFCASVIAYPAVFVLWKPAAIPSDQQFAIFLFAYLFCSLLLFACKDGFAGFSPGKWLTGIRVLDYETRKPAGFWASFKRNLALVIPYLNLVAMLIIIFQPERGRRWGDGWARTIVVWLEHENKPPFNPSGFVCFECGYDLRGNVSGVCPECGAPIPHERSSAMATEHGLST